MGEQKRGEQRKVRKTWWETKSENKNGRKPKVSKKVVAHQTVVGNQKLATKSGDTP